MTAFKWSITGRARVRPLGGAKPPKALRRFPQFFASACGVLTQDPDGDALVTSWAQDFAWHPVLATERVGDWVEVRHDGDLLLKLGRDGFRPGSPRGTIAVVLDGVELVMVVRISGTAGR